MSESVWEVLNLISRREYELTPKILDYGREDQFRQIGRKCVEILESGEWTTMKMVCSAEETSGGSDAYYSPAIELRTRIYANRARSRMDDPKRRREG